MQGKDFSHPLEMTMLVMSDPSAVLRINSVRDLSLFFFKGVAKVLARLAAIKGGAQEGLTAEAQRSQSSEF